MMPLISVPTNLILANAPPIGTPLKVHKLDKTEKMKVSIAQFLKVKGL